MVNSSNLQIMKLSNRLFAFALLWTVCVATAYADTASHTLRIKAMRCEECAHKVNKALRANDAVENVEFDLEKRTATIEYDDSRLNKEGIEALLAATGRYKPSPYDPTEKIRRAMGMKTEELRTADDSTRVMKELWSVEGMDSVAPRMDKRYVFIRYDANKTNRATIKQKLTEAGFTPVNYYTSNVISHAYMNIPAAAATEDTVESVMALDGVDDACVNPALGTLAITFVNTDTTEEKLKKEVKEIVEK